MTLLKEVKQNGKSLIGIMESGEEIPIVIFQWFESSKKHILPNLRETYRNKLINILDNELKDYYLIGESIYIGTGIAIPYIKYKKTTQ